MLIECKITSYSVVDNAVVEKPCVEQVEAYVNDGYLCLSNCAASAPIDRLRENVDGWLAQGGTKPIYIQPCPHRPRMCAPDCGCGPGDDIGGWGGRNYPQIFIEHDELMRVLRTIPLATKEIIEQLVNSQAELQVGLGHYRLMREIHSYDTYIEHRMQASLAMQHDLLSALGHPMASPAHMPEGWMPA